MRESLKRAQEMHCRAFPLALFVVLRAVHKLAPLARHSLQLWMRLNRNPKQTLERDVIRKPRNELLDKIAQQIHSLWNFV
jgi:hypothetical protein